MTTEQKLTKWFPPRQRPARVGVYQTDDLKPVEELALNGYQYWSGKRWGGFCLSPSAAYLDRNASSKFQKNYWRGLSSNPKAKA